MVRRIAAILTLAFLASQVHAKTPASESLLPNTTKGWVSIPDVKALEASWKKTQLGKLMNDPVMKPFAQDLRAQLRAKLNETNFRLGIGLEDVTNVASGELSLALAQPGGDAKRHAIVLLVDTTGNQAKVDALMDKVRKNLEARGATSKKVDAAGQTWLVYTIPVKRLLSFDENKDGKLAKSELPLRLQGVLTRHDKNRDGSLDKDEIAAAEKTRPNMIARYLVLDHLLISTNDTDTGNFIAAAAAAKGQTSGTLQSLNQFKSIQQRTVGNETAHIRWYVDPFGYAATVRAAAGGKQRRGKDLLKLLKKQGFDALQAVGGQIGLSTTKHEILHRTFVYAPPVKRAAGDTLTSKYNKAARILRFPNAADIGPSSLVPPNVATHLTFNWKVKDAFKYIGSLVDEYLDTPGAWKDMLNSIKVTTNGPQVDIENEIVAHLGQRVTLFVDVAKPITAKSERIVVGIKTTNFKKVQQAIHKMLKTDKTFKPFEVGKGKDRVIIYQSLTEGAPDQVAQGLDVDCLCGDADKDEEEGACEEEEEEAPLFPNACIAVAHGHLLVSTHREFLTKVIERGSRTGTKKLLKQQVDHKRVTQMLTELSGTKNSFRFFTRTDEAYQTTYDLIRTGKMPQSQSLLGKVLNRALAPSKRGETRKQQINGGKLPPFVQVKKYLGPAGFSVTSETEGWLVVGALLKK